MTRLLSLLLLTPLLLLAGNAYVQAFTAPVASQNATPSSDENADVPSEGMTLAEAKKQITYTDGLILGLVEGITEYLPVSSTGHLLLTNRLLNLDTATPLFDKDGQPITIEDNNVIRPFTMADATNAYAIIIQGGAIIAVVIIYWKRLMTILMGMLGKDTNGRLLLRNLIVSFLPAAVLGLLFNDWIEKKLFHPEAIAIALVAGALLMLAVEGWRKKHKQGQKPDDGPDLHELSLKQCLIIGLLQCVAMWPGTSRSTMTIVGGYLVGLSPARAAEFSFLLGLVTLSAAAGYKTLSLGPQMMAALEPGPVLFGIVVATVSAALAVKWLVSYLTKHGLALFAWYRIALAAGVAALMFAS